MTISAMKAELSTLAQRATSHVPATGERFTLTQTGQERTIAVRGTKKGNSAQLNCLRGICFMRYGGRDSLTLGTCPRCSESIDKQAIGSSNQPQRASFFVTVCSTQGKMSRSVGLSLVRPKSTVTLAGSLI